MKRAKSKTKPFFSSQEKPSEGSKSKDKKAGSGGVSTGKFGAPTPKDKSSNAPTLVVVQGPPKSGKTTLIQSLVKHFCLRKISEINGTITIRAGRKTRITFVECPNDISSMIDYAKVADLVLILVDASLGFEMETFEFLSILQTHGFPNAMGVLTHLDFFKENKQQRRTKKILKKRFAIEASEETKFYYLSGMRHGFYPKNEVANLARFISFIKVRPVLWKQTHPFVMADRWERDSDGKLSLYGYVRGASWRPGAQVYINGIGDFTPEEMSGVRDPVPPVEEDEPMALTNSGKETRESRRKRTLKKEERVVYAPHMDLGFLNFDKSGTFVTIPDSQVVFTRRDQEPEHLLQSEGVRMVRALQEGPQKARKEESSSKIHDGESFATRNTLDEEMDGSQELEDEEDDAELIEGVTVEDKKLKRDGLRASHKEIAHEIRAQIRPALKLAMANASQEIELAEKHAKSTLKLFGNKLQKLIYGSQNERVAVDSFDSSKFPPGAVPATEDQEQLLKEVKSLCVTGQELEDDEEGLSDGESEKNEKFDSESEDENEENSEEARKLAEEKSDEEALENLLTEEQGVHSKGQYVKIVLSNFPEEIQLDPNSPLFLARVNTAEDKFGFLKARILKHRFYSSILKSGDPLIVSIGWRRYQTLPLYAIQDPNDRLRALKYTPPYDYCQAIFYGVFVPQDTGVICYQSMNERQTGLRISATGFISELRASFEVKKKLKLVGEPFKIFKNTAFIKGMFNSELEVAKFQGAQIRTVSGIRGQVKKAIKTSAENGKVELGSFRATFEDRIVMSDLVFCRTWTTLKLERFYNPILSHSKEFRLMKTARQLREESNVPLEKNPDSEYKEIERKPKKFTPLIVPKVTPIPTSFPFILL